MIGLTAEAASKPTGAATEYSAIASAPMTATRKRARRRLAARWDVSTTKSSWPPILPRPKCDREFSVWPTANRQDDTPQSTRLRFFRNSRADCGPSSVARVLHGACAATAPPRRHHKDTGSRLSHRPSLFSRVSRWWTIRSYVIRRDVLRIFDPCKIALFLLFAIGLRNCRVQMACAAVGQQSVVEFCAQVYLLRETLISRWNSADAWQSVAPRLASDRETSVCPLQWC